MIEAAPQLEDDGTGDLIPAAQRLPPGAGRPNHLPPGLLGIPCHRDAPVESAEAIFKLAHQGMPDGSAVVWSYGPSTIAANRNRLVRTLLRNKRIRDLEWICMCDSDAVPPAGAIERMLSRNVDVVGALYCLREPPFKFGFGKPVGIVREPLELKGLLDVRWTGTHFILIRRRVLEAMSEPWFDHKDPQGKPTPGYREDVYFCEQARKLGFHVYVDLDTWVGHMAWVNVTPELALHYGGTGLFRTPREDGAGAPAVDAGA